MDPYSRDYFQIRCRSPHVRATYDSQVSQTEFCSKLKPYFLQLSSLLIEHVESDDPTWKGYLYAILLFLASFGGTLMMNQYFYKMTIVGLRVRTTVIGALYKKALLISNASREGKHL